MKLVVVAVFDHAVKAYARPFMVRSQGEALRSFIDEVNRKADDNALSRHPEDYELVDLARFDEESGEFTSDGVKTLIRGKDAVKAE